MESNKSLVAASASMAVGVVAVVMRVTNLLTNKFHFFIIVLSVII